MAKKRRQHIVKKSEGPPRESPNKGLIGKWKQSGLDESIITQIELLDTRHELTGDQLRCALALFQRASEDERWQELGEYTPEPGHRLPLDDALRHLSIEEALAFLEQADLFDVAQRETLVSYVLAEPETPFYTLDELAVTTDKAVRYHERNRKYLLQYGHSLSDFGRCRFLWRLLSRLYYVKMPHKGYRTGARALNPDLLAALFPPGNFPEPGDSVSFWDEDLDPITNAYDEWEVIEDIPLQDMARLEGAREKLYDLKLRTLRELARAARAHDADALWERVLNLIRETITAEEAEFYLRVDRIYEGYDIRTGEIVDEEAGLIAGGLTALLEVVGHYEKEIRIGPLHRCKTALEAAGLAGVDELGRGELRTSDGKRARSYFAFVKDRQRGTLDAALDQFVAHPEEEARFRDEYRTRVNVALENELYEEITIRRKIRRSLAHKFEPHVSQFADWAKACLEVTGDLPTMDSKTTDRADSGSGEGRLHDPPEHKCQSLEAMNESHPFDFPEAQEYHDMRPLDFANLIDAWERAVELLAQALICGEKERLGRLMQKHGFRRAQNLIRLAMESRGLSSEPVTRIGEVFESASSGFGTETRPGWLDDVLSAMERLKARLAVEASSAEQRKDTRTQAEKPRDAAKVTENDPCKAFWHTFQLFYDVEDDRYKLRGKVQSGSLSTHVLKTRKGRVLRNLLGAILSSGKSRRLTHAQIRAKRGASAPPREVSLDSPGSRGQSRVHSPAWKADQDANRKQIQNLNQKFAEAVRGVSKKPPNAFQPVGDGWTWYFRVTTKGYPDE